MFSLEMSRILDVGMVSFVWMAVVAMVIFRVKGSWILRRWMGESVGRATCPALSTVSPGCVDKAGR